ncbi:hypothetical protein CVT24_006527 [Panaeolus cyanescens]|uniref:RRM domain-containing protein n=1 Tax=Panaeolus cyanescens TaxID=181874 RepID=A0A409VZR9_9AGAR|nr:hypothetical protein CVT24_006527 [Panaeolus cyanescens]
MQGSTKNKTSYHGEERRNINAFHGPKKQLLGVKADIPPPAWKKDPAMNGEGSSKSNAAQGSRVFLSNLPSDDLFKKTVGPLKECFLVYNSQGKSKGMAVITFQRAGDSFVARQKYNGKIIDGRRHIKLEILLDQDHPTPQSAQRSIPSLLNRISPAVPPQAPNPDHITFPPRYAALTCFIQLRIYRHYFSVPRPAKPIVASTSSTSAVLPRRKVKKGPKRIKKKVVTLEDLDKEMEDYRAAAPSAMEDTF